MMYELEKMWISESTQSCMDMADKSTYGDGRGHICRAFHVGYSTTGHGSTETNSPNNPSQSDRVLAKNDYHHRTWVCIFSGFVWRHPFHLKEPNASAKIVAVSAEGVDTFIRREASEPPMLCCGHIAYWKFEAH